MVIDLFVGAHLFQPAALEWTGNQCLNGCAYCFANINKGERVKVNVKSPINQLYRDKPITHADRLLQMGHTICISNRTDPFTKENFRDTIAVCQHLSKKENSIFFQTKTGYGIEEVCDIYGDRRDNVFYITITTLDDTISKRIEPFAPLPKERLQTAAKLTSMGYLVVVAVNPCVERWMGEKDLKKLCVELKKIGITNICIEMMDLSTKRVMALSDKRKDMMGEDVINDCRDKKNNKNKLFVRKMTEMLIDNGMDVGKKGMPFRTNFYDNIKKRLHLQYPVLQEFVNYAIDNIKQPRLIKYDEYEKVMAWGEVFDLVEQGEYIRSYLLRSDFRVWKDNQNKVKSHKQLLKILWNDKRARTSIRRHCMFPTAQKNGKDYLDVNGNIQLFFDGHPYLDGKGVIEI